MSTFACCQIRSQGPLSSQGSVWLSLRQIFVDLAFFLTQEAHDIIMTAEKVWKIYTSEDFRATSSNIKIRV